MYAIVETGSKQYLVEPGDEIRIEHLPVEEGKKVKLDRVLLVNDGKKVKIGTPTVKGASVSATVLRHEKGPKVTVFKYFPKQRYRVKTGHRQNYTRLRIEQIKA